MYTFGLENSRTRLGRGSLQPELPLPVARSADRAVGSSLAAFLCENVDGHHDQFRIVRSPLSLLFLGWLIRLAALAQVLLVVDPGWDVAAGGVCPVRSVVRVAVGIVAVPGVACGRGIALLTRRRGG